MIELRVEEIFVIDYYKQPVAVRQKLQAMAEDGNRESIYEPINLTSEQAAVVGLQAGKYFLSFADEDLGEEELVNPGAMAADSVALAI